MKENHSTNGPEEVCENYNIKSAEIEIVTLQIILSFKLGTPLGNT